MEDAVDELQPCLQDVVSLSSGSSIELLDVSDEGQYHVAVGCTSKDAGGNVVSGLNSEDEDGEGQGEEFSIASLFVSTDLHLGANGSESSTGKAGESISEEVDEAWNGSIRIQSEASEQCADDRDSDDQEIVASRPEECEHLPHDGCRAESVYPSNDVSDALDEEDDMAAAALAGDDGENRHGLC